MLKLEICGFDMVGQLFGSSLWSPGTIYRTHPEPEWTRNLLKTVKDCQDTVNLDRLFQDSFKPPVAPATGGHIPMLPMLPNGVHFPIIWASLSLDTLPKVNFAYVNASRHSYAEFGKDSDWA